MSLNESNKSGSNEEKLSDFKLYVPTKYLNSPLSNSAKSRHLSIASGTNRINFNYSPDLRKKSSYFKSKNLLSNGFPFNNKTTNSKSYIDIASNSNSYRQNSQLDLNKIKSNSKTNSSEFIQLNSANNSLSNFELGFDLNARSSQRKYSKFVILVCCVCCIVKNCIESQNQTTMTSFAPNQTERQSFAKFILKKAYLKFKFYSIGLCMSLVVCLSFVCMTYLLRRALNLTEFSQDTNSISQFRMVSNIEFNRTRIILDCNFCYFVVWSSTSCLLLVYPVFLLFFIGFYKVMNFSKKSKSESTLLSSFSSDLKNSNFKFGDFVLNSFDIFCSENQMKKRAKIEYRLATEKAQINEPNSSNPPNQQESTGSTTTQSNISQFKIKRNFLLKVLFISTIWILTGYSLIRAIDLLHCSDVVVLYSVNYSFVYMTSWIVLHHLFIPLRLLGFILSIAAIIFTYYSEGFAFDLKFLGNLFATSSAAGSAILQIIWSNNTKNKNVAQKTMFLSLIGLSTFLFGWPFIFLLKISGIETLIVTSYYYLSLTQFKEIFICVIGASVFGFLFSFSIQFGQHITKEIFLQIGCWLTIPTVVFLDTEINKLKINDLKFGSIVCVFIGYLFLILPNNMYSDFKKYLCPEPNPESTEANSLTRRYRYSSPASPNHNNRVNIAKLSR
ncbi:thiamine transporter SLC35F3 isoform X1 [Brachionus plicatilis]|uniref:Thiamine transporter SLC35F3 isoform X1 n=1 Tax=Brachionus plicatilis TaxID=10195 RepID=A0A3M7R4E0_BRAPC|nr:thiamine transporter SLC35F3 isoform X1 [Brachionus plicatilis]